MCLSPFPENGSGIGSKAIDDLGLDVVALVEHQRLPGAATDRLAHLIAELNGGNAGPWQAEETQIEYDHPQSALENLQMALLWNTDKIQINPADDDLWLGPIRERPYHPAYTPFSWRGWWDFGTGALGDMGCHIIDHAVWALKLGTPTAVESRTTLDGSVLEEDKPNFETYPIASMIYFQFPARGDLPPVSMIWYDGGLMPPAPAEMPSGQRLPDNGVLYIGSRGKLYHGSHGGMPQLLPASLMEQAKAVPQTMERSPGHYEEWVQACRGGNRAAAGFDYSGPMTETVLLGVLSLRAPGTRLEWDAENQSVKNAPELNQFVHIEYRKGWTL